MTYPLINIDVLVKELLALKVGQEDLTKRVWSLEKEVAALGGRTFPGVKNPAVLIEGITERS